MGVSSSRWETYSKWLESLVRDKTEGPLFDRKRDLYESSPPRMGELIHHFIALANAARRRGEPALLVFGAEDKEWRIVGIDGQHIFPGRRGVLLAEVEEQPYLLQQWHEEIERQYINAFRQWVEPRGELPDVDFECGPFDGKLVACLSIPPVPTKSPYRVLQGVDDKQKRKIEEMGLQPGACWRRIGANTFEVSPDSEVMQHSWHTLPFIPKEGWLAYLEQLACHFRYKEEGKVDPYLPLQARIQGEDQTADLSMVLKDFAHAGESRPAVLVLCGPPGCGKTTALGRLVYDLADAALADLKHPHGEWAPGRIRAPDQPTEIIPVFVSLRGLDPTEESIAEKFVGVLNMYGGSLMRLDQYAERECEPADVLTDRDIRFLVILDGLDEATDWTESVAEIQRFLGRYPHARFVVSCRATHLPNWLQEQVFHLVVSIEPLDLHQVRLFLDRSPWLEAIEGGDLLSRLRGLLTNPRKLSELGKRSPDDPGACTLGIALDSIVQGFLETEVQRFGGPGSSVLRDRWQERLQCLAYKMNAEGKGWIGKRRAQEILGDVLSWAEQVGFLEQRDTRVAFVDRSVQDYFAARAIMEQLDNETPQDSALEGCDKNPRRWVEAIRIAANLWPDDLTQEPMVGLLERVLTWSPVTVAQCIAERQTDVEELDFVERVCDGLIRLVEVDRVAADTFQRLLGDPDIRIREVALEVFRSCHAAPLIPYLEERAEREGDPDLRSKTITALEEVGSPRARELRAKFEEEYPPKQPLMDAEEQDQDIEAMSPCQTSMEDENDERDARPEATDGDADSQQGGHSEHHQ